VPFTFSHPAVIFPAKYLPPHIYSLTGLVAGSIAPDFEYFIRMNVGSIYSHSLLGLFWFDLPMGILAAFVFHCIVRDILIDNFPQWLYERFARFKLFNWVSAFKRNWLMIIISILVGAATHIIWDDFTHPGRYFVRHISFLREEVEVFGNIFPLYNLFQFFSSLLGAFVILVYIIKLPAESVQRRNRSKIFIPMILVIAIIIFGIRFSTGISIKQYGNIAVTGISALLISMIVTSLILKKVNRINLHDVV
jgi:hypothetical protein